MEYFKQVIDESTIKTRELAEAIVAKAREDGDKLREEARARADAILSDARAKADDMRQNARLEAARIMAEADRATNGLANRRENLQQAESDLRKDFSRMLDEQAELFKKMLGN